MTETVMTEKCEPNLCSEGRIEQEETNNNTICQRKFPLVDSDPFFTGSVLSLPFILSILHLHHRTIVQFLKSALQGRFGQDDWRNKYPTHTYTHRLWRFRAHF
jgi:hypothetical protein